MPNDFKVICGGQTFVFASSQEALDFFVNCFRHCDPESSEASRYMIIIQKLMNNETNITDGY